MVMTKIKLNETKKKSLGSQQLFVKLSCPAWITSTKNTVTEEAKMIKE